MRGRLPVLAILTLLSASAGPAARATPDEPGASCCGDGSCDPSWEGPGNCGSDCPKPECGDGVCQYWKDEGPGCADCGGTDVYYPDEYALDKSLACTAKHCGGWVLGPKLPDGTTTACSCNGWQGEEYACANLCDACTKFVGCGKVAPGAACGDGTCVEGHGEDGQTCPQDCYSAIPSAACEDPAYCGVGCWECGSWGALCCKGGQCDCEPDCQGKLCGDYVENCPAYLGGVTTCPGPCPEGLVCADSTAGAGGMYSCVEPCGEVPEAGCCAGQKVARRCWDTSTPGWLQEEDCGPYQRCAWSLADQHYQCMDDSISHEPSQDPTLKHPRACPGTSCEPHCLGWPNVPCGTLDGCGQKCQNCPAGYACDEGNNECMQGCGSITEIGCCNGNTSYICVGDGVLDAQECDEYGKKCGWIPGVDRYGCANLAAADPFGKHPRACGCTPQCQGRQPCTDDGCGGTCGACCSQVEDVTPGWLPSGEIEFGFGSKVKLSDVLSIPTPVDVSVARKAIGSYAKNSKGDPTLPCQETWSSGIETQVCLGTGLPSKMVWKCGQVTNQVQTTKALLAECLTPPTFTCNLQQFCAVTTDSVDASFGLNLELSAKPDVLGAQLACGVAVGATVGVRDSYNLYQGVACPDKSLIGQQGHAIRVVVQGSGSGGCTVKLGSVEVGTEVGASLCTNAGIDWPTAQAPWGALGGASFKLKLPAIQIGWLQIGPMVWTVFSKGSGC